jgi:hypothetical protein
MYSMLYSLFAYHQCPHTGFYGYPMLEGYKQEHTYHNSDSSMHPNCCHGRHVGDCHRR